MPGVGEGPEDDDLALAAALAPAAAETSPNRPSQRSTAAKSQSRRSKAVQPPEHEAEAMVEDVKEERPDPNAAEDGAIIPVEDGSWDKLKQRRLMPGAATSDTDFEQFFASLAALNLQFQKEEEERVDTTDTILHKVRLWTETAKNMLGLDVPDYLVRLSVGVLAFGRVRQADIFLREHALLYWIAEGGRTLRFHSGDCFMKTPSGAFQQHRGIPPDHDRVQAYLMHVEGLFRLMSKATQRTTEHLLDAVKKMWSAHEENMSSLLEACVDACLTFEGDPVPRRGRHQEQEREQADEGAPEEDRANPTQRSWNSHTAKTIMIVKKQISQELTQDKLLHYMSEWCDTPKSPEPAVCYEDCAIRYDDGLSPAVQVSREQLQNCYLRVPHCIKSTVSPDVVLRLLKFYSQTFWGNVEVFRCCQAAQALAKRGLNVVRLFIGLSSGGVGQSLFSTHLQAIYCHNFAFFDPQIWFNEEEMRKQVEQLNGCIILTGQETPGTGRTWVVKTMI